MWFKLIILLPFATLLLGYSAHLSAAALHMHIIAPETPLHQQASTDSTILTQLSQDTVVIQLDTHTSPAELSNAQTWHQVQTADKQAGWIQAGQLDLLKTDAANTSKALERAGSQLQTPLTLQAAMQLLQKITAHRAADNLSIPLKAEWELLYLQALQKSTQLFNELDNETQQQPQYLEFLETYTQDIYQSDYGLAGWFVQSDRFWELHKLYGLLSIGDRIAWAAATNPVGGECEGAVSCHLYDLNNSHGQYLRLYPQGKNAENALTTIAEILKDIVRNEFGVYYVTADIPEDVANFEKEGKYLHTTIARTTSEQKAVIVRTLQTLMQRYPESN